LAGLTVDDVFQLTKIDRWFLHAIRDLLDVENELRACPGLDAATPELMLRAKQHGFADNQLAMLWGCRPTDVRRARRGFGIDAVFTSADAGAAESEAYTPYYYSTYEAGVSTVSANGRREPAGGWSGPGDSAADQPAHAGRSPEDEVRPHSGRPR